MEKTVNVSPEIFEDDKIRYLFTFRNGDALFVFFLKLLCFCKKQKTNGALAVAGKHDTKTLSAFLGKKENFIKNAFALFSDIGLLTINDDTYVVKNWNKYQNSAEDKFLEKKKKQAENWREYMRDYRQKQQNVRLNVILHDTLKEKEEKEKEKAKTMKIVLKIKE